MKIAVIGIGYVGLSNAIVLAQHNEVVLVDVIEEKVNKINLKKSPIAEPLIVDYLEHRAGKKGEAFGVVEMTVEAVSLKVVEVIYKIIDHSVIAGLEYTAVLTPPGNGYGYRGNKLHFGSKLLRYARVKRHNDAATYKSPSESLGKGACNVSKAARHGKGVSFACCVEYFHLVPP